MCIRDRPYSVWAIGSTLPPREQKFENGFIALVSPSQYFSSPNFTDELAANGLFIGNNALVFYETREDWNKYNPDLLNWQSATNRTAPLGGYYVARIPATTAINNGERIIRGFATTASKGAGIRIYEYASTDTIKDCRWQLESLFWLCADADVVAVNNGMTLANIADRKTAVLTLCNDKQLLDESLLIKARIINRHRQTICPLCLEKLSAQGFFNRMEQALSLIHISEPTRPY